VAVTPPFDMNSPLFSQPHYNTTSDVASGQSSAARTATQPCRSGIHPGEQMREAGGCPLRPYVLRNLLKG
jgi:hypothetical protein